MNEPIKVFLSYSHKDDEFRQELIAHLSSLRKRKLIELWHDRQIIAGADWADEIDCNLELADIILFLVSADFINSEYCYGKELALALERDKAGAARALPVLVRPCDWETTPLGQLQAIPHDNRPISTWGNKPWDEPLLLVVKEIEKVARDIKNRREAASSAAQKAQAIQEYRAEAESYFRNGVLLAAEKTLLELKQQDLNLADSEVATIWRSIEADLARHRANLGRYRDTLVAEYQRAAELSSERRGVLQQLQKRLGISDGEAGEQEQAVLAERDLQPQTPPEIPKPASDLLRSFSFEVVTVDGNGREKRRTNETARFFAEDLGSDVTLEMVYIPGGIYQMGSPAGQGNDDERPQHAVTVPAFLMGKYPVTQEQWRAVAALPQAEIALDAKPSYFQGDKLPVENVFWSQGVEFCQRLSRRTGHGYRLPSEAEWEYACRAGSTTPFYFGETLTPKLANYSGSVGQTSVVGNYSPNAFGFYDMHGNVWEWCADRWHENYIGAPADGSAWLNGESNRRVIRGGSWFNIPAYCRAAYRLRRSVDDRYNYVGFRVVCAVFPGLL